MIKIEKNRAFALFKKPFKSNYHFISGSWFKTKEYQKINKGYLLAPFDVDNDEAYFIEGSALEITDLPENINALLDWTKKDKDHNPLLPNYKELVNNGINIIKDKVFRKLVLSRIEKHPLSKHFDIKTYFENISKAYPECFIYLFYIPNETCWLGASPEPLAKSAGNGEFNTIALAGTMHKDKYAQGRNWSDKEIIEQEFVTSFILEKVNKYTETKIELKGPENIHTGNLMHLQTSIKTKIPKGKIIDLVLELHPTPAVSGLPQEKAIEYIIQKESYQREFYSGFSGPIEEKSIFEFYVNLRCMQLFREEAILYAGAGITSESEPEKEYIETANKINALKRFLNASSNTL